MRTPRRTRNWFLSIGGVTVFALAVMTAGRAGLGAQAPTPAQSLDQILKEVATYDGGIESAAMWKLRDYVYARKDSPAGRAECEAALLTFLKTDATPVARMAAARHLRVIGSDSAVPPLEAMLADERSADLALYALQQIFGAAAEDALIRSLKSTGGATRIAVIGVLAGRKDVAAVPALVPLLQQPDTAEAAAIALGRIGGDSAAGALVSALAGAAPAFKGVIASSILSCADSWMAAKNAVAAQRLYETLSSDDSLPGPLRRAAAMGGILAAGDGSAALLMDQLRRKDTLMQEAAIAKIADVIPPDAIAPVCAIFPRLPDSAQIQVLAVLSGYPPDRVLVTVLDAARSNSLPVRVAALRALEGVGGPAQVPLLAGVAAGTKGPEQSAARTALGMLKGRAVDDAIVEVFRLTSSDSVAGELLLAMAERRMFAAKPIVAGALAMPSNGIRTQALKTLRVIGTPSDIPAVLNALLATDDDAVRAEAEQTAAALARKISNSESRASAIRASLAAEGKAEARVRLIGLLPLIGDPGTLQTLRTALADANPDIVDAAAHAITAWPTSAARDDVLRLARTSKDESHRLLAIRGLINSVGQDRYREPEAAVADLKIASGLATRPDEQKLVLGALVRFPCKGALDLATGLQKEPAVAAEAKAAIENIKGRMTRKGPIR